MEKNIMNIFYDQIQSKHVFLIYYAARTVHCTAFSKFLFSIHNSNNRENIEIRAAVVFCSGCIVKE